MFRNIHYLLDFHTMKSSWNKFILWILVTCEAIWSTNPGFRVPISQFHILFYKGNAEGNSHSKYEWGQLCRYTFQGSLATAIHLSKHPSNRNVDKSTRCKSLQKKSQKEGEEEKSVFTLDYDRLIWTYLTKNYSFNKGSPRSKMIVPDLVPTEEPKPRQTIYFFFFSFWMSEGFNGKKERVFV